MHRSIATIQSPEFINLQPLEINPLMSACEIKVLYVGENRNGSYIDKQMATEMSKTLRGAPIVGYYKEEKQDFRDHGHEITFNGDGINEKCLTVPYGFVSPDAKVWFKTFEDVDDFGNSIEREYLMTTGYLWTGQFEEANLPIKEGRPQSMELDSESLKGKWSTNNKNGMDFFIISDAIFSKLCILGDDVEPCFEGASVTEPQVSRTFSLDNNFKTTLFTMMQDLKDALGGQKMENFEAEVNVAEQEQIDFSEATVETTENNFTEETSSNEDIDFEKKEDEEKEEKTEEKEEPSNNEEKKEEDEEDKKKYELADDVEVEADTETVSTADFENLQNKYEALQSKFEALEEINKELVAFKNAIDDEKKIELINSFYMIADEDKKEILENKSNYSYDDIKAKLSVLYVEQNLDFNKKEEVQEEKAPAMTFNLEQSYESVPSLVSALNEARKKRI